MPKTTFVFQHASLLDRALAWGLVVALVAAFAFVLHRYAKWPWLLSMPVGVLGYVVVALAVVYGRLVLSW
ncbi:MAG: hypothetical protein JNL41_09710 [Phenylobacterium sp.]|uniref:hypothetical protein n=1 Tax=Phenylobacterium sp. TaxID=1871053 RepID=UPI001A37C9C5|nr:hypothetical protein [Phenylobacterium sp.]MBL8554542.1 hypothetical protein [Phenylobacterium sp.]